MLRTSKTFFRTLGRPAMPARPRGRGFRLEQLEGREVPAQLTADLMFHSLPGAKATLYLDFDGHTQPGNASFRPGETATPFSLDNDTSTLSADEKLAIREIWQRVAEDYSPFNIDVTTEAPTGNADGRFLRAVIGYNPRVFGGEGAYDTFRNGDDTDNVAFINFSPLSENEYWRWRSYVPQTAATASHEAGHVVGLAHQALYDANGELIDDYNPGRLEKAPIMGQYLPADFTTPKRATWWRGSSPIGPNSVQDDVAVIAGARNGFGFRTDEHGVDFNSAEWLNPASGTDTATGSGVISTTEDADYYSFVTTGGTTTIRVNVAHSDLEDGMPRMLTANLDVKVELYRMTESGEAVLVPINGDPNDSLEVNVSVDLQPGVYFVVVRSHGEAGDVGQYTLQVTTPAGIAVVGETL